MDAGHRILASLDPAGRALAIRAALIAAERGLRAYLVGGVVRDAWIGRARADVDIAIRTPDPRATGAVLSALQRRVGGRVHLHPEFGTGVLDVGGLHLDVTMTRAERYAHPAALPSVRPGTLRDDLERRDYRCNAIAVALPPAAPALVDPLGGRDDLAAGRLRSIHAASLRDDPTRIARGARLVARLGLDFDATVRDEVTRHLTPDVLRFLASERRRHELELTLAEPAPGAAIDALADVGALTPFFGLGWSHDLHAALVRLDAHRAETRPRAVPSREGPKGAAGDEPPDREAYLLVLAALGAPAPADWLAWLGFPDRFAQRGARVAHVVELARTGPDDALGPAWTSLSDGERHAVRCVVPGRAEVFDRIDGRSGDGDVRRVVRGRDLVDLGMPPGPAIGRVLERLERARAAGEVASFEAELGLARRLAQDLADGAANGTAPSST